MSAQRYLVSARKYRPQIFAELVAQEHVTETLKNAIRLDRLAHAYLFSGPRGVGKTTAARILAKAVNCTTPLEDRADSAEPCRECETCRTFEEGRSLNIIEIDAASNNRVDDIRDLRDTVRVHPQAGTVKVYIIDEVHMLSTSAFNALLKTLEEPPPYVLFIFATTEPHKVLPTILSRCQRFDFRRIAVQEIVSRLRAICQEEHISSDDASLMLIARKGDGALRDALSIFDQAVSLCGSALEYAPLTQALGVVDVDLYFDVSRHIIERSSAGMLRTIDHVIGSGYDLQEFVVGLAEHLRNLLVARASSDAALIEDTEAMRTRYKKEAARFSETDLLRLLTVLDDAEESMKTSVRPRLKLETALLKMATITLGADLRQALAKIDRLEAMVHSADRSITPSGEPATSGSPSGESLTKGHRSAPVDDPPTMRAGGGEPAATERAAADEPAAEEHGGGDERSAEKHAAVDERPAEKHAAGNGPGDAERGAGDDSAGQERAAGDNVAGEKRTAGNEPAGEDGGARAHKPAGVGERSHSAPAGTSTPSAPRDIFGEPAIKRRTSPPSKGTDPASPSNVAVDTMDAVQTEQDAGALAQAWSQLLAIVKEDKIHVGSLLQHSRPEHFHDGTAAIAVPDAFHHRLLTHQSEYVIEQIQPLIAEPLTSIRFVIRDDLETPGKEETASNFDPYEYMQRKRQENPVIRAIFDQFGGELVW